MKKIKQIALDNLIDNSRFSKGDGWKKGIKSNKNEK